MASFLDVCRFTAASSGTGSFVVSSAVTGYQTPASANAVNGATYRYRAESADLTQWEVGTGVYTVSGTTLTRTVLFSTNSNSAVSFTSAPQVAVVELAEDMGPLTLTNATLAAATPSNPTGISGTSNEMLGLGGTCTLTPKYSSRVLVTFDGSIEMSGTSYANMQVRYGTGTAPINGAAVTGTQVGGTPQVGASSVADENTFRMFGRSVIITGLAPGTAYWFDLAIQNIGSQTTTLESITCNAMEF